MILCECESKCGTLIPEFDSRGNKRRFVKGHNSRGKILSPETRQLISENRAGKCCGENNPNYGKHPSEETRKRMSTNHSDLSGENNPNYGKHHSPEIRQLISDANTGTQVGEDNPNWNGGTSKLPYCSIWTPWLKEEIKERDKHQCMNPSCSSTEDLCIHHINYDKKNCSTNNLITLCRSCNAKANFNREHWKEFYSNILMINN